MRAIVLTRDKKAIIKNIDSKRSDWAFRKSVYILDPNRVQNFRDPAGEITGQELIFFEENPNPLNHEDDPTDLSSKYLDNVVIINFIQQTTNTFGQWNMPSFGFLSWFVETPSRIPFALMIGVVVWTIISNYLISGSIS